MGKMVTDMSERGIEEIIELHLNENGYVTRTYINYDPHYCIDKELLMQFLITTQSEAIKVLKNRHGVYFEQRFFKRISDQIRKKGIVKVLRDGFRDGDVKIKLYYKRPSSETLNAQSFQNFQQNIFSVMRQVHYSESTPNKSLDMVLFINGLPVITMELKNTLTRQTFVDAIRQYRNDRDPKEELFKLGRCLVHFALDDQEVYMTTELKGDSTTFLPFNKGYNFGKGNPPNPNGLKTDYLWKEVLEKNSLANIIEWFSQLVEEEDEDTKKITKKQIFPRYHQLEVVRKLLYKVKEDGPGHRYLIQHSAGSGKSNSLTWLAHQLSEFKNANGENNIFDSVIVVTDRKILDKQIRDNIKQFSHVDGVMAAATKSSELKAFLESGKKIIVTTIQKFPYVVKDIGELKNYNFAIIIDEAHSSQGGNTSGKMNAALSKEDIEIEEEITLEDKINEFVESQRMPLNVSYFAFTATPKNKTLEIFGDQQSDGTYTAFHNYSMKQAIEEEFILDVLKNYTTYESFYKLYKKIEDDPKFDSSRARGKMRSFVETNELTIAKKANIMLDHFLDQVYRPRKVNGKAKAMIVTRSVISAIRYKEAFDRILKERNLDIEALVAFEGSRTIDDKSYDESSMNGFPGDNIRKEFKKDKYRFLIVAEKFQTGFDQPLLHTMYVDKILNSVRAVQTLSRLNRAYKPYKNETFVLDFANTALEIKEAFDPFYKTTVLSEGTDPNRLNDLYDDLVEMQVFSEEEIMQVIDKYLEGASREVIDPMLEAMVERFKQLPYDDQVEFKTKARAFHRAYSFLSQILPYNQQDWTALATTVKYLLPKLPKLSDDDLSEGILEAIDIDSYRVDQKEMQNITLEGNTELDPASTGGSSVIKDPQLEYLSEIVRDFNEKFGKDLTENDSIRKFMMEELPQKVVEKEEYQNTKNHSDRQNAKIAFKRIIQEVFQDYMFDQFDMYQKFTENEEFREWYTDKMFEMDYRFEGDNPS
ncbi:DEAD/DEAH box helicase family protein [Virgibacillus sp. AGTR]|uniref:type I restriction endonuclease subunit R n=1 Tax=Virgibacillus sp. AGTR TaxID=2812055 RepID=UPI001D16D398|nr:type I restriction endonuclease [Virgibacillus sp. AGTR]MCC2251891.1 DEAD/DEAH box helicase family protein [Virgibacillus sp. AGTR]